MAISASSYISNDDADTYFSTRLNSEAWDYASDQDKYKALVGATRAIDALNFVGLKTDSDQINEFPRNGDTLVPEGILIATCEIAITVLEGFDIELEREALHATSKEYANVRETYNRIIAVAHIQAGICSTKAWDYLQTWLCDPSYVKLSRVN